MMTAGERVAEIEGPNVRIETLVAPELADRILGFLAERYLGRYAVIAQTVETEFVQGGKYL